jgi:hypothetical protein
MARSCTSGRHSPAHPIVRNQGFDFSHCRHCACDLIRSDRSWRTVPRGFRVVWRGPERPLTDDPAQLQLDFSAKGRSLIVWSRQRSIWRLGAVAGLAIIGFLYFLYTLVDRLHSAWKRVAAQHLRRKTLKLPAA